MRRLLAILALGLFLSVLIYPWSLLRPSDTLPDDNDTRLIAYIIGQVQNNLLTCRVESCNLYHTAFFAPYPNTLAYSDLFLTSAIVTLPFRLFTSSPVIIFNLAHLINSALTFVFAFLFFALITKSNSRGLLAALIFFLSGFHLTYLAHLQVYSLWAVFLALYSFHRRLYFLFFLAVTLQLLESIFPVYLIFFAVIFQLPRPSLKILFRYSLLFVPLWLLLLFPYLQLTRTFTEAIRPIRDAAHFSLGLDEIFTRYHSWTVVVLFLTTASAQSIVSLCELTQFKNARFPALAGNFWTSMQISRARRRRGIIGRQQRDVDESRSDSVVSQRIKTASDQLSWKIILSFSLIMSLGPVLKLFGRTIKIFGLPIPLPYTAFYYLFPGFQGFRTPSRFIVLAAIAASALIALKLPKKPLLCLLFISLLLFEARLPLRSFFVNPTPPPIYRQVAALPKTAVILELPILLWNQPGHEIESLRSLYSLEHHHRRLGGFSGFAPLAWIDLVQQINAFGLNQRNLARLRDLGITHVLENNRLFSLNNYAPIYP